jgi:hypothetical protein
MLQGPPGEILEPISLENSLKSKTTLCLGSKCRPPESTQVYMIGNIPTFDSTKGAYLTQSDALRVGNWEFSQSTNGNLEIFNIKGNRQVHFHNVDIKTLNTDNIYVNKHYAVENNTVENNTTVRRILISDTSGLNAYNTGISANHVTVGGQDLWNSNGDIMRRYVDAAVLTANGILIR